MWEVEGRKGYERRKGGEGERLGGEGERRKGRKEIWKEGGNEGMKEGRAWKVEGRKG